DPLWGTAGLTGSAGVAGWVGMVLLRAALDGRIGATGAAGSYGAEPWAAAPGPAPGRWGLKVNLPRAQPIGPAGLGPPAVRPRVPRDDRRPADPRERRRDQADRAPAVTFVTPLRGTSFGHPPPSLREKNVDGRAWPT